MLRSIFVYIFFIFPLLLFSQDGDTRTETDTTTFQIIDSALTVELPEQEEEEIIVAKEPSVALQTDYDAGQNVYFSQESPYHCIGSHLYFLQRSNFHPDSSAMTLYIENPESIAAQKRARQLIEYYDGEGYFINLSQVPKDSNYMDSMGNHIYYPIVGEPDIFVVKYGDKWYYSAQTVRAIPKLHRKAFPFGIFRINAAWAQQKIFGISISQLLGMLFYILIAIVVHKLLAWLLGFLLDRLFARYIRSELAHKTFKKVARPLSLLIIFWLLRVAVPSLLLPIQVNQYLIIGLKVALPIFAVLIFYQLVDLLGAFLEKRAEKTESNLDDQLAPLVTKFFKGVVVVFGILFVLQIIGVNITALLAGISIGGLALALAAQDTVKNFFGSLMIFLDRPFQVGDWIQADGIEGTVEEVGVRSTRIRTFEDSLVYIPNAALADGAVNNMGLRNYRRFRFTIGLTYDTPPSLIEIFVEGLRGIVKHHPAILQDEPKVYFNSMGDFSLNVLFHVFIDVPTFNEELKVKQEVLLAILRLGEKIGVNFAFPTQTLQIETFPEKQALSPVYEKSEVASREAVNTFLEEWKSTRKTSKDETGA